MAEHELGKFEVDSSNLSGGSNAIYSTGKYI